MKRIFVPIFVALALAGCGVLPPLPGMERAPARVAAIKPLPPPPDPATQMTALENRVAVLVLEARQKLDPKSHVLAIDPELTAIARARAQDMASKNYLAHAAPNGDTSASLLMAADEKFQGLLGENLAAQHYTKQGGVDPNGFAQRFLDTWLASAPHKENLVYADYSRTGVGAAVNGDTVYVAQLFASDIGIRKAGDASVSRLDHPADAKPVAAVPAEHLRGAIGAGPPP